MASDDVEMLYQRLLENQSIARSESESSAAIRQSQMRDYYSMWVHQIKTPISAMKLLLEVEREELGQLICDDEQSQYLLSDNMDSFEDELFRIEEYVSMALQYQRVSSTENDFYIFYSAVIKGIYHLYFNGIKPTGGCRSYEQSSHRCTCRIAASHHLS